VPGSPLPPGQIYPQTWLQWALATLQGIGAPATPTNLQTLWAWTAFEKPAGQPTQWNNPLNTTQPFPGAQNQNSVGVKSYPNISAGAQATSQTLLNGYYPALVQALRSSTPRSSFSPQVLANLTTWGSKSFVKNIGKDVGSPTASTTTSAPANTATNSLDLVGAISGFGGTLSKDIVGGLEVGLGLILMLGGIAILVLMAFKADPVAAAKRAVSVATPAGRVAAVASSAAKPTPAAAKLSPAAASAVSEAKAGRGSKLSPEVKAELRTRGNAA